MDERRDPLRGEVVDRPDGYGPSDWRPGAPGTRSAPGGPAEPGGPTSGVYAFEWGWGEPSGRQGLPWIGVFLVVFGALLLLEQLVPQFEFAGSMLLLAVGIAFLVKWALDRGVTSLYAGAIITALALPDVIEATGVVGGPGLGTFCLGIAFLAIAAVRGSLRGGWGWQVWLGLVLFAIGGSQLVLPAIGGYVWPALLVIGGVVLLAKSVRR